MVRVILAGNFYASYLNEQLFDDKIIIPDANIKQLVDATLAHAADISRDDEEPVCVFMLVGITDLVEKQLISGKYLLLPYADPLRDIEYQMERAVSALKRLGAYPVWTTTYPISLAKYHLSQGWRAKDLQGFKISPVFGSEQQHLFTVCEGFMDLCHAFNKKIDQPDIFLIKKVYYSMRGNRNFAEEYLMDDGINPAEEVISQWNKDLRPYIRDLRYRMSNNSSSIKQENLATSHRNSNTLHEPERRAQGRDSGEPSRPKRAKLEETLMENLGNQSSDVQKKLAMGMLKFISENLGTDVFVSSKDSTSAKSASASRTPEAHADTYAGRSHSPVQFPPNPADNFHSKVASIPPVAPQYERRTSLGKRAAPHHGLDMYMANSAATLNTCSRGTDSELQYVNLGSGIPDGRFKDSDGYSSTPSPRTNSTATHSITRTRPQVLANGQTTGPHIGQASVRGPVSVALAPQLNNGQPMMQKIETALVRGPTSVAITPQPNSSQLMPNAGQALNRHTVSVASQPQSGGQLMAPNVELALGQGPASVPLQPDNTFNGRLFNRYAKMANPTRLFRKNQHGALECKKLDDLSHFYDRPLARKCLHNFQETYRRKNYSPTTPVLIKAKDSLSETVPDIVSTSDNTAKVKSRTSTCSTTKATSSEAVPTECPTATVDDRVSAEQRDTLTSEHKPAQTKPVSSLNAVDAHGAKTVSSLYAVDARGAKPVSSLYAVDARGAKPAPQIHTGDECSESKVVSLEQQFDSSETTSNKTIRRKLRRARRFYLRAGSAPRSQDKIYRHTSVLFKIPFANHASDAYRLATRYKEKYILMANDQKGAPVRVKGIGNSNSLDSRFPEDPPRTFSFYKGSKPPSVTFLKVEAVAPGREFRNCPMTPLQCDVASYNVMLYHLMRWREVLVKRLAQGQDVSIGPYSEDTDGEQDQVDDFVSLDDPDEDSDSGEMIVLSEVSHVQKNGIPSSGDDTAIEDTRPENAGNENSHSEDAGDEGTHLEDGVASQHELAISSYVSTEATPEDTTLEEGELQEI